MLWIATPELAAASSNAGALHREHHHHALHPAAGGLADGRGLAAALALGADGVMMATRFLATKEAGLHPNLQRLLLEATERDTTLNLQALAGALARWE